MKLIAAMIGFLVCAAPSLQAQTRQQKLVGSSGGFLKNGTGSVSFTIGESMIPTYKTKADIVTLGFQQDTPPVSDSLGNYRSILDGRWVDKNVWQLFSGYAWVNAAVPPDRQTGLAIILDHITDDTVVAAGKVRVGGNGKLSIDNSFTMNPRDSSAVLTVNTNGILELNNGGALKTPLFTSLPILVNLEAGTFNINGGSVGSPFSVPLDYLITGNQDSNGVKSQVNINNSFLNTAIIQMNAGAIHWYAGDISGPSTTSNAGFINNYSFSIVTTGSVPMHVYDMTLDNRKNLVIDTAAGQSRHTVYFTQQFGAAFFINQDTATVNIIAPIPFRSPPLVM